MAAAEMLKSLYELLERRKIGLSFCLYCTVFMPLTLVAVILTCTCIGKCIQLDRCFYWKEHCTVQLCRQLRVTSTLIFNTHLVFPGRLIWIDFFFMPSEGWSTFPMRRLFYSEGGEMLAEVAQRDGRCPIIGNIPGQFKCSQKPYLAADVPVHSRDIGLDEL